MRALIAGGVPARRVGTGSRTLRSDRRRRVALGISPPRHYRPIRASGNDLEAPEIYDLVRAAFIPSPG